MDFPTEDFKFGLNDVGLTHPENKAFIRIDKAGRIYIMSQPNLGIIIDPAKQSISFISDKVNVITKEDEGFKWNEMFFNGAATNFAEPTFVYGKTVSPDVFDHVEDYLDDV